MALDLQTILDAAGAAEADKRADTITAAILDGQPARSDVEALLNEAVEKFGALNAQDDHDDDSMLGLELLAEVCSAARGAQTAIDDRAEEAKAVRDALAAKVSGDDTDTPAEEPGTEEVTETAEADTPAEEPTAEAVTEVVETAEAVVAEVAPEPVTASVEPRRYDLSKIKTAPTAPQAPDNGGLIITAAADVRGFAGGQELSGMDDLVAAATAKIEAMPEGQDGVFVRAGYAQIKLPYPKELVASGTNDQEVIDYAADPSRLRGKNGTAGLVAAGGWCAPSETLYDLAPLLADPNAGLIDLPDIAVKRGGIRTTEGADFATIWAGNVGLIRTEAQEMADPYVNKTLFRVPCTSFTEVRADVVYTGIEAGILQNSAYPELTRQYVEGALTAHAHKINASSIARMVTLAGSEVDLTAKLGPSATGSLLNGLELLITDYRYKYRAPESLTLEVVLPIWAKSVVRSDLSLRAGDGSLVQVTDQQIVGFFAARGARVQWVYDWQDAFSGVAAGFGKTAAMTDFPTSVNALIYAGGTFVRGRGEVVNLEAVYDSTNIVKNDFLQLFVEEKLLVHRRMYKAINAKFPLGVRGATGAPQVLDGNGKVVPE